MWALESFLGRLQVDCKSHTWVELQASNGEFGIMYVGGNNPSKLRRPSKPGLGLVRGSIAKYGLGPGITACTGSSLVPLLAWRSKETSQKLENKSLCVCGCMCAVFSMWPDHVLMWKTNSTWNYYVSVSLGFPVVLAIWTAPSSSRSSDRSSLSLAVVPD